MVDPQPLASWNESAAKSAILDFVARVTNPGGADFAPPAERIAVFDNDGTLLRAAASNSSQRDSKARYDRAGRRASSGPMVGAWELRGPRISVKSS
jgi:hypothetical protein